jgi:phosphatidylethanolamine-binding protein (PEBP) family uncharacterized protein
MALLALACAESPAPRPDAVGAPPTFAAGIGGGGSALPAAATCVGAGLSPAVWWSGLPEDTADLLLVLRSSAGALHWAAWSLRPADGGLPAGIPSTQAPPLQGRNAGGVIGWLPPCSPPAAPDERLQGLVYALSEPLLAPPTAELDALLERAAPLTIGVARFELRAFDEGLPHE